MLLSGDTRCADKSSQAVGNDGDYRLVVVFLAHEGCDGPHLTGVTRRRGRNWAPKLSGVARSRSVAAKHLFQHSCNDQRVQQGLGAQDTDLSRLGVVGQNSKSVIASDQRHESVCGPNLRNSSAPLNLPIAVLKSIGDVVVGSDQSGGNPSRQQPQL